MPTMTYSETLTVTHCWCGIALAIPDNLFRNARNHGQQVYCPIGHQFGWHETEADKLRKEKAELERRLDSAKASKDFWQREHEDERKRHSATKGVLTKTKKRVTNGVCPCCNRSFVQLARHMKTKHPHALPLVGVEA